MMATITYKVPKDLIDDFTTEALKNKDRHGHVESLALVAGHWNGNQLIANDLIFPKQRGTSNSVEDLGKYSIFILSTFLLGFTKKTSEYAAVC